MTIIFIRSASELNHLIKSRKMRWVRHIVHLRKQEIHATISVRKPQWKRLLVRSEIGY
jgi:hypothetical protein